MDRLNETHHRDQQRRDRAAVERGGVFYKIFLANNFAK